MLAGKGKSLVLSGKTLLSQSDGHQMAGSSIQQQLLLKRREPVQWRQKMTRVDFENVFPFRKTVKLEPCVVWDMFGNTVNALFSSCSVSRTGKFSKALASNVAIWFLKYDRITKHFQRNVTANLFKT